MTNIITAAAIAMASMVSTNISVPEINKEYVHFNADWPTQKMIMVISNCPVVAMGYYSFPRLTDKQFDMLTNYYKMTNMTIQFYAPADKK